MPSDIRVLIDSDAFVGWMVEHDAHHLKTVKVFNRLKTERVTVATTSLVVGETATVLSHLSGQSLAKTFLSKVIAGGHFPVIFINEALHKKALEIFKKQTQKGTSVTDCANVAVIRKFSIPSIFSFDKIYPKKFNLELIT